MKTTRDLPDRGRPGPKPGRVGVDWGARFAEARKVAGKRRLWVCVGEWDNRYSPAKVRGRVARGEIPDVGNAELEVRQQDGRYGLWVRWTNGSGRA